MTKDQEKQIIELLWGSMVMSQPPNIRAPYDEPRVETGWGTKTQTGLVACIARIMESSNHDETALDAAIEFTDSLLR